MTEAFADTQYWIAVVYPRDQWRDAADRAASGIGDALIVTTEEVLVELLAFASGRGDAVRVRAGSLVRALLTDPGVEVIPQSHESVVRGLELYQRRADKGYSLVDCISMVTMSDRGITDVLSGDVHFRQEGFVPLIDPEGA